MSKLLQCMDCKHTLSINAKSCTECGSSKPFKGLVLEGKDRKMHRDSLKNFIKLGGKCKDPLWIRIISIIIFLWLISLFFGSGEPDTPEETAKKLYNSIEFDSAVQCQIGIKKLLKYPDSASFIGQGAVVNNGNNWVVKQTVNSNNSLGAKVKSTHYCDLKSNSKGEVTLIKIN